MDTKRIFVLGNGFDLAHYLPTAYVHFMDAMMVVESLEEDQELGFDDLFQKYIAGECSDREKGFFRNTKELYKIDDLRLSIDTVKNLQTKLKNNGWFQHFKHHLTDVDTWIDFENEIEDILLNIDVLLSRDFDNSTILSQDISVDTEYSLDRYQIRKASFSDFLGDTLVQFSPKYLNDMKFKSSQIQRILRDFSIISKVFGSCEEVGGYSMSKEVDCFMLHGSYDEREKAKAHKNCESSLFMTFDIDRVVDKKYLNRFSRFYTGFKGDEVFRKLLTDLGIFSEIFTSYIELVIDRLAPIKSFDNFGDLGKEIDAVYTFNYSNTFERLYPKSLENQLNRTEVQYIHGSAERKNIVLGISDLGEGKLKKYKIYGFVKTFQKLVNNTDYMFLDNNDVKLTSKPPINYLLQNDYEIIIWGHSLDSSDGEYIREMFNLNSDNLLNRVTIKIWYHGSPHTQLANLMHIMGKDVIQEWMKKGWLVFQAAPDIYVENKKIKK
ncbi:AbiH family protein [Psychrobacter sp.]|uniref:AbiH family protein n=1 Tax=Psychrobacter sp. TaxID=56811 RepID=UPI002FD8F83E